MLKIDIKKLFNIKRIKTILSKIKTKHLKKLIKTLINFLINSVFAIPLSAYIYYILIEIVIVNKMQNISVKMFEPINVINTILHNKNGLVMFLLIYLLLMAFMYMLMINSVSKYKSDMIQVTDKIEIPKPVGQLQHGSARFATEKEKEDILTEVIINEKDENIIKLVIDGLKDKKNINQGILRHSNVIVDIPIFTVENAIIPIEMTKESRHKERVLGIGGDVHTLVIGATRSGKTRTLVIQSIVLQALAGTDMFISDPKGELYNYTYPLLTKLGYAHITIDFKNPSRSDKYNFLQFIIDAIEENNIPKAITYTWDIVDSIVDKATDADPLWSNGEKATLASAILLVVYDNSTLGLKDIYPKESEIDIKDRYKRQNKYYQNMTNVYYFIATCSKIVKNDKNANVVDDDPENITVLNQLIEKLDSNHPAKLVMATVEAAPDKTRGSFIASALATLRLFTDPNISSITQDTHSDILNTEKKKAIFIILPDERETYYPLASIFTNQYYQFLVSVADKRGGRLERCFKFNLDEFGNFTKIPSFDTKMTVGAGRGIHFVLYVQGIDQFNLKYGKELANLILGNCHYWIYLKTKDATTLEMLSKSLGKYTVMGTGSSVSDSGKMNANYSFSNSLVARSLLETDELMKINRPYMLVLCDNGFPVVTKSPDLSKWKFNEILGLGDVNHNVKVREIRENSRKIIEINNIKLWDYSSHYNKYFSNIVNIDKTNNNSGGVTDISTPKTYKSFTDYFNNAQKDNKSLREDF